MIKMARRERLEATLAGQPVDRMAVALWRHFPVDDLYADELARAHLEFQQLYDFDFIKVTPSYTYCVADWGVEDRYDGNDEGIVDITRRPVGSLDDWSKLRPQDPRTGARGEQLRCLELIRDAVRQETPFIPTVFNPLGMLLFLAGEDAALAYLRREPTLMKEVLGVLAETTVRFVEEAMKRGAAGIFYALLYANYRQVTESEYVEFGRPYDLRVLEAARDGWLNVLHLHGDEVRFDLLSKYAVPSISWDDRGTPPSLADAMTRFPGALVGGINQWGTMLRGRPAQVRAEVQDAIRQTAGRRLIVGTGCVTPITTPTCNIRAARLAVES